MVTVHSLMESRFGKLSTRVNGRVRKDGFMSTAAGLRRKITFEARCWPPHPASLHFLFFFSLRSHLQVAFGGLLVSDGIDTSACRRITPSRGHPDGLKCNYMCWINYEPLLLLLHCCGAGTQVKGGKRKHVHTHTHAQREKKKLLNVETDVPGILITVISTPTLARFED